MAWTDDKVRLLRLLWRSNWTPAAIGAALDMRSAAVTSKLFRLRKQQDLTRKIMKAGGALYIDKERARALLSIPGFLDGLKRGDDNGEDAA